MVKLATLLAALLGMNAMAETHGYHWSIGPFLPQAVQEIYPTVFNNSIYVAGGLSAGEDNTLNIHADVYQLGRNDSQWHALGALPEPRHHGMLVGTDDGLWLFGGYIATVKGQWTNTNTALRYQPESGNWEPVGHMPVELAETVSGVINGEIHFAGGRQPVEGKNGQWKDNTDTDWHGVYDPLTDIWRTEEPLPVARNSACSVVVGHRWHIIGGRTVDGGNSARHDIYDSFEKRWERGKDLPEARGGLACVYYQDAIYVFGGEYFDDGRGVFYHVFRYNLELEHWDNVNVMPVPRHGLGAVTFDGKIWLIGGASEAGAKHTRDIVSVFERRPSL